jgi:DNA invertase Pin-like site-specific DNA recombinase
VQGEFQLTAKTDRQQLARALASLTPGDTLVVCKLDRLVRSTRDLLNTLAAIAAAGATFKSLGVESLAVSRYSRVLKALTMICSRAARECCAFPEKSTHLRN